MFIYLLNIYIFVVDICFLSIFIYTYICKFVLVINVQTFVFLHKVSSSVAMKFLIFLCFFSLKFIVCVFVCFAESHRHIYWLTNTHTHTLTHLHIFDHVLRWNTISSLKQNVENVENLRLATISPPEEIAFILLLQ